MDASNEINSKIFSSSVFESVFDSYLMGNTNGYLKLSDTEYAFFGSEGKRLFLSNEQKLTPFNASKFNLFARKHNFPIIMNFVEDDFHLKFKKDFDRIISNNIKSFSTYLSVEIQKYWKAKEYKSNAIDIFDDLLEFIIEKQLLFYFDYKATKEDLTKFSFYEDYFAFGLYINDLAFLEKYYSFEKMQNVKDHFDSFFYKMLHSNYNSIFYQFLNNLKDNNYSKDFILSQFYNISIAGTTNIAKAFVYILNFCEDQNLDCFSKNHKLSENEIYHLSGKLIVELYRLLPYIDNQIVSPYIFREVANNFNINEHVTVKKGDKIYYYHLLQNISDNIDSPLEFNPFRTQNDYKGKSSSVFGAGLHRCCGASLTDTWLHYLLVEYLKSGLVLKSENGLQYTTYNPDFEEIKKVSYMVKPSKDEKN